MSQRKGANIPVPVGGGYLVLPWEVDTFMMTFGII
jgi:hypothetical protein